MIFVCYFDRSAERRVYLDVEVHGPLSAYFIAFGDADNFVDDA
ncbi:unknown [Prevotella sp. CAG:873]|nr:unknown [Prevotella sp. CAG:873]